MAQIGGSQRWCKQTPVQHLPGSGHTNIKSFVDVAPSPPSPPPPLATISIIFMWPVAAETYLPSILQVFSPILEALEAKGPLPVLLCNKTSVTLCGRQES